MQTKENSREKIEALTKQLEDGVQQLRSSAKWKEYLLMQAKMPHYSYNNCILIAMQTRGEATYCMSFKSWEKLGRHVKSGEKGIQIICPAPTKVQYLVDKRDSQGNVISDDKGAPLKEKIERTVMKFRLGYTFDVTQTDGKPLPEVCRLLEGDVDNFHTLKEAIIKSSPVPVLFEPVFGSANGYYSPSEKRIVVDSGLSEKHQIHTLLHEIGHAVLDISGADNGAPREQKEVEAESISFICLNALLGEEADPEELGTYSFGYVAGWGSEDLKEMKKALTTIQQAASEIIGKVELAMSQLLVAKETAKKVSSELLSVTPSHRAACM